MKQGNFFQRFSITTIWIWLAIFALVPNFLVLITSLLQPGDNELVRLQLSIESYQALFNTTYFKIFARSFVLAGTCTLLCLLIAYPFSYALARMPEQYKGFLLLLVIIPFWTSSLIRSYAIIAILKTNGLLNKALLSLGLIDQPLHLMYTGTAVMIGLVYSLLPFMILPLYANIEKLDRRLLDAASDLGANGIQTFFRVILPLTLPGILAGSMLVFLPAMTLFYIPDLLGGAKNLLLGNLIQNQFLAARNWPMGAAVSIALTIFMGLMLLAYRRTTKNSKSGGDVL
jgi:spermidine/putrescine transport system permease protein